VPPRPPGRASGAGSGTMGPAIEDIVAAEIAYRTATERGVGQVVSP